MVCALMSLFETTLWLQGTLGDELGEVAVSVVERIDRLD